MCHRSVVKLWNLFIHGMFAHCVNLECLTYSHYGLLTSRFTRWTSTIWKQPSLLSSIGWKLTPCFCFLWLCRSFHSRSCITTNLVQGFKASILDWQIVSHWIRFTNPFEEIRGRHHCHLSKIRVQPRYFSGLRTNSRCILFNYQIHCSGTK